MYTLGGKADQPRVKNVIQSVVAASAGLILATALPLARDAVLGTLTLAIALGSFALLVVTRRIDTFWVVLASAGLALVGDSLHLHF
jgi:chromate transporter